jgi:L-fuconolactonase
MVGARLVIRRIDAHHHVWDLAVRDQPWMTGDAMSPIARSFGIDEFAADARANGIDASVVVQTVTDVVETEELLDLAAAHPVIAGVVGWVDVGATGVGEQLDRLMARTSASMLVGIRSLVQYEPDPSWLQRPAVLAGMREVARRGLVNELLLLPHQTEAALGAIAAVSDGHFVVDHLAKPAIAAGTWEPWATDLAALAQHENVSAKISGLVTEAAWSTWTAADLRRYVDHALSVFGPDRIVFGTDWPVCTLAASYQQIVELAADFVTDLSPDEQESVLGGNAARVYSLDTSTEEAP